jgi:hypothetical protein
MDIRTARASTIAPCKNTNGCGNVSIAHRRTMIPGRANDGVIAEKDCFFLFGMKDYATA